MYRNTEQRTFARTLRTAEKNLWQFLRANQLANDKFRRQAAIGATSSTSSATPKN